MSQQPGPILLATDLSARGDRALDRALQLAKELDTKLVVLHVMENHGVSARLTTPVWRRLAAALRLFPEATYLTELYPDLREHPRYRQIRWGVGLIGKLTRGGYPLHYRSAAEIEQAFIGCGFGRVGVLDPQVDGVGLGLPKGRMPSLVRVVEARV